MEETRRYPFTFIALSILLVLLFVLDLFSGTVYIAPTKVWENLFSDTDPVYHQILVNFRFTKALTALLTGMSLSLCGMLMQTLFRNPLAGPYVLGISSGASLGVALAMMGAAALGMDMSAFSGKAGIALAACTGGFLSVLMVLGIARQVKSNITLLLVGMMIGHITGALQAVLEYIGNAESVKGFILWNLGSLGNVSYNELGLYLPAILLVCCLAFTLAKPLNALLLGENYATSMGVNLKTTRIKIIALSGILAGLSTAFCGPIAFIGIAIPHLCRMLFKTSDHRVLIPVNLCCGAIALISCDIISQLPGTGFVLPINIVTSLAGAPVVIWIILKTKPLN